MKKVDKKKSEADGTSAILIIYLKKISMFAECKHTYGKANLKSFKKKNYKV